jgi:hypothetical protein
MSTIGIDAQIAEVRRELEARDKTYTTLISKNVMTMAEAAERQVGLGAVLRTLEWIKANEATIRRVHEAIQAAKQLQLAFPDAELIEDEADA